MYNSSGNSVFSDSSREELMKALEPFMKSSSSTFPLSSSSSSPSSCSYSQLTPSQPYMDPEFCSPSSSNHLFPNHGFFNYNNLMAEEAALAYDKAAYMLRGDFARLSFPHLKHQGAHVSGEFGGFKPLYSFVDAKLQAEFDQSPRFSDPKVENPLVSSSTTPDLSDESLAGSSSPESDITFLDFFNSKWDDNETFSLEKYSSVEIDWEAIRKLS
ncbi:hypothetical protein PVK06_043832 [Gossypium arboreum]|uniref:Uncharacterized protein n=1 Tax=Gossypium arboreum TaxID=29729 RepID=A0ABR0MPZ1_GOSAR|nr:hypothetical protein PVK06_043832 [Gossypium arboreum]